MAKQQDYYERFANEMIERIKKGTAPWQKPWQPGEPALPRNMSTDRAYRGGNSLYLAAAADRRGYADNRWATFRQIKALGGHVRKGEKGEQIVHYATTRRYVEKDQNGKPKRGEDGKPVYRYQKLDRPIRRTYTVFNAEQTAGLKLDRPSAGRPAWQTHRVAEAVIDQARTDPSNIRIRHAEGDRAYYHLKRDEIVLPLRRQFPSANNYYQTALHELGHATGHPDRMDRKTLQDGIEAGFGSPDYAREELRAEISAMMTGDRIGAGHDPARGDAYAEGWIKAIEDDPRAIHSAAADAQKISDYLIDPARERIAEIEKTLGAPDRGMRPEHTHERDASVDRPQTPTPSLPVPDRSR